MVDGEQYTTGLTQNDFPGVVPTGSSSGAAPKAFLNWIVFDRDFNMLDGGFLQVSTAARETGTDVPHERLAKDNIAITKPGYVYIYLSNENGDLVEVFFDDFRVEHVHGEVVQMDDYYPFGLQFNSYQRENSLDQEYLYNGKELQNELDLGWLDYGARMYKPEIGRWMSIDPLGDKRSWLTPYNYVQNQPILRVDPSGMLDVYGMDAETGEIKLIEETKDKHDRLVDAKSGEVIDKKVNKGLLRDGQNIKKDGLETTDTKGGTRLAVNISMHTHEEISGAIYKDDAGNKMLHVKAYEGGEVIKNEQGEVTAMLSGASGVVEKTFTSSDGTFTGTAVSAFHTHPGYPGAAGLGTPKPGIWDSPNALFNWVERGVDIPYIIYARHQMTAGDRTSNMSLYRLNPQRTKTYWNLAEIPTWQEYLNED